MICKETFNFNKIRIYNGTIGVIKKITGNTLDILFENGELRCRLNIKYFDLANAYTVYKSQGRRIKHKYNILLSNESKSIKREEVYTMLTRATCIDNIHMDYERFKGKIFKSCYDKSRKVVEIELK
jgi:ATP-dependent exoDNAse (exonuclease V) alpha subunit